MATASARLPPATFSAALAASATLASQRRKAGVNYVAGLSTFGGHKAQNSVVALGVPVCTEQSFAKVVSSLKRPSREGGCGTLSSSCSAAGEIFTIAAIMNGLVLVGVAVGFVLLGIESSLEEASGD